MKKTMIMLVLMATASWASAQNLRWGINAGTALAQVHTEVDNDNENSASRWAINVGIMADIPIGKNFSFQPGLNYLQKGGKETTDMLNPATQISIILNYLELPLNMLYKAPGKSGHFFVGLGPSIGYAISGKTKYSSMGSTVTSTINLGGHNDELRHFEFGANLITGYEWKSGWLIAANYNLGITNQFNDSESKWKNRYFGFKIGYLLGGDHK